MRLKITLSYDGSRYLGFQVQKHTRQTVAGDLYSVLHHLRIDSKIVASGRTDAGVHATKQTIHIDVPHYWEDPYKLKMHLNHKLPPSIRIKSIRHASEAFHARYSAKKRTYCYVLTKHPHSVFESFYAHYEPHINTKRIQAGLDLFTGTHDFGWFQKEGDQKSSVRTLFHAKIHEYSNYYLLRFTANGFLRSQIRMMVSALLKLNHEKITLEEIKDQLEKKKRVTHSLASPAGLYLTNIAY